jgi:CO/xanthine dehydrogenase FAD-binding subunit
LYFRPKNLDDAIAVLNSSGGQILAGGTDFYPALGERLPHGDVVDITAVREISGISAEERYFRIGGLTTWAEVGRAPLPRCFDALKGAAREIGSVQIQNRATVGGNLCNASPAADSVPALLVLNAEVELLSSAGARRMALAEFITGNRRTQKRADEVLTAVLVPRQCENAASAFLKLGARKYLVISISMVAVILESNDSGYLSQARVAVGSCSAVARRLAGLEKDLVGHSADPQIGSVVTPQHLATLSPIDDLRATAEYRRDASVTLVRRALQACVGST